MKPLPLTNCEESSFRPVIQPSQGERFDAAGEMSRLRAAQVRWQREGLSRRLRMVRQFRFQLVDHARSLAEASAQVRRRPLAEVISSEILPLAEAARFLEGEAPRVLAPRRVGRRGRPLWLGGVSSQIMREPYGLVLVLAPGNYPVFLAGVQILQALAAGNAVLLKPAPGTTAALEGLLRCLRQAGLPDDLLRLLPEAIGPVREVIQTGVDLVLLTGSAQTGEAVLTELAPHLTPAVMELSGCDAVVVRADADLDLAARGIAFGLTLNGGATCIAPHRVLVSKRVASELEGRLAQAFKDQPPLPITSPVRARLAAAVREALSRGAHMISGKVEPDGSVEGPLVLAGVPPGSSLLSEDFFAPVMSIVTVEDDADALRIASSCPYQLGTALFSRDIPRCLDLADQLPAGVVSINDLIFPTADPRLPFGGARRSGFGVTRGAEGLLHMTRVKVVTVNRSRMRFHYRPTGPADAAMFLHFLTATHGGGWGRRMRGWIALGKSLISSITRTNQERNSST